MKLRLLLTTTLLVLSLGSPLFAGPDVNTAAGLTLAGAPLALRGYDPVSYFTAGKPTLGSTQHMATHNGAAYQFTSAENKKKFEAAPDKFAPQYGGFCAFGVALGKKSDGDPLAWKIVDGKLYLNYNADIQSKWNEDVAANLKKSEAGWPAIKDVAASAIK